MALVTVAFGVLLLLILMMGFKIDGFISLILVSLVIGLMLGMPLDKVTASMYKGIGSQLNSLILILAFGAMLGKLLSDSGAANRIAMTLIDKFGKKNARWAMLLTALIVGITMFYEAGFIVLIPIVYTVVVEMDIPLMSAGLPVVTGLSITHTFLPPHPGPALVVTTYGANMGKTLLLGLLIAIPSIIILELFYNKSKWALSVKASIPEGLVSTKRFKEDELPGFGISVFTALIPVILMAIQTFSGFILPKNSGALKYINFIGDAPIALLLTVLFATYTLGIARGKKMEEVMKTLGVSVKAIAMIILVIGAGGAFKQVIVDAGIGDTVNRLTSGLNISPLILAWVIAAAVRTAVGSATVAISTAAGIILPMIGTSGVSVELMVLATSCGSMFASHVNDPGFWMFKEYFNLSVVDAIKVRTPYTCLLSVFGLIGVLVLSNFF
ncbi:gluconate:H+ symporter [Clostridium sp. BL-8]|uniref:gluconate:H+ symporter n=1 Tax=Clostridium sp. BL-8 TaxID=349938 RepID=UPI00098BFE57|nr:gluconate:H+ symporter [Clostridium sp. BL-8]OOM80839.1 high-affinity gluconate transporter [Clostridium sp. BL-8]